MCKININQELNGIELSFDSKPEAATLDEIKRQGFRWNRNKRIWYAKQTADRLIFAETLGQIETTPEKTAGKINLEDLGQNTPRLGGAELTKAIREDLKRRGVKGCTVRVAHYDSITVTVKASPADFTSLEEFKERYSFSEFSCDIECHGRYTGDSWCYSLEGLTDEEKNEKYNNYCRYEIEHRHDFNNYHRERKNYPQYTTAFCEKLEAVYLIANQWNYDNSDPMTDYFDRGYYLDIDIKCDDFNARETMTDEERKAYEAEQERERAEEAARLAQYEEERRQAEEESRRYEAQRKEDETTVYNNIRVEDLSEPEQFFIYGLRGGIGKECSLEELIKESKYDGIPALITRKVIFSDLETFEKFGRYLLEDWIFTAGKGGTASEDVRLENIDNIYSLNEAQRESVEWFNNDCIGCFVGDEIKLVIDPQWYNYCRYCYIPNNPDIIPAPAELERMRTESTNKQPFYFPAPVSEQIENITPGDEITIYMSDGWILNNIEAGSGIVTDITPGNYAQYEGYYITLSYGKYFKGDKRVFIRDNKEILIYKGIKPRLPESVTTERINNNMVQVLTTFDGLFNRVIAYYDSIGDAPILDTIQR